MTPDDDLPDLASLRDRAPPPVAAVHLRVSRRAAARRGLAVATVAAAAALVVAVGVGSPPAQVRDRGVGGDVVSARLEVVVEGEGGPRALGGAVQAGEGLVFGVSTSGPAWVTLEEVSGSQRRPVWPAAGAEWRVDGHGWVGGEQPLAWRPDAPVGAARYELLACPDRHALATGDGCASDAVVVRFE